MFWAYFCLGHYMHFFDWIKAMRLGLGLGPISCIVQHWTAWYGHVSDFQSTTGAVAVRAQKDKITKYGLPLPLPPKECSSARETRNQWRHTTSTFSLSFSYASPSQPPRRSPRRLPPPLRSSFSATPRRTVATTDSCPLCSDSTSPFPLAPIASFLTSSVINALIVSLLRSIGYELEHSCL